MAKDGREEVVAEERGGKSQVMRDIFPSAC